METVKEFQPDIVTLDLRVPEVSGWELLRQLKATEETAPIPIIISSIIDDIKHVKSLGASECLIKPFELHDFVQAVQRAMLALEQRGTPSSPQHEIVSKESTPLPRQGPPVILLAEDNESSLHLFTNYLKSANFRVVVARNGEEALDALEEITPDMILMDIQMPGMDGLEAIGLIREMPRLAKTPILALTALAMPQDEKRCLDAGANGYMTKPVSLKNLLTTIKNHLEESRD
jgi:CheY-like chemotaxis protein